MESLRTTVHMETAHMNAPVVINSGDAQRMAQRELAKPQYHVNPNSLGQTTAAAQPPPPPPRRPSSAGHVGMIVLVILAAIVLVIAVILVLRRLGRPRTEKKSKKTPAKQPLGATAAGENLVGAARHRRDAQLAADAGDWAEAIRERFRAVISTLDERGLLPERPDRTADEAAHDAGVLLPTHASVLAAAARAFDDVEYGEYVGTPEGYRLISEVDELVGSAEPESLAAAGGAR